MFLGISDSSVLGTVAGQQGDQGAPDPETSNR
jgi:hypothetical protein